MNSTWTMAYRQQKDRSARTHTLCHTNAYTHARCACSSVEPARPKRSEPSRIPPTLTSGSSPNTCQGKEYPKEFLKIAEQQVRFLTNAQK